MIESVALGIAVIVVLGILAQWLAWRLQVPSILLLLLFGFLAGPVTHLIDPDHLFGELLFPFVSLSVGIILFEGGLSLRIEEVRETGGVVRLLITVGVLITWLITAATAFLVLNLSLTISVLLGAILVVTGPTVVIPLLRQVRPSHRVSNVLKWEGILIDPVGATLAVLVFEAILDGGISAQFTLFSIARGIIVTLLAGGIIGFVSARLLVEFLKRRWIPSDLEAAIALMVVVAAFTLANEVREEAGLMAVTVMGVALTNQRQVSVKHIASFKEELGLLLLSILFIVLAARLELAALVNIAAVELIFLAILILVTRPISVWVSSIGSKLPMREKLFLSAMAPRGIVAASVASLFALELEELGLEGAEELVTITFLVVVATVLVYSLSARPLAQRLGLTQVKPQGTLIVGAHFWARMIAHAIKQTGLEVWLVDTNSDHVESAQKAGLNAYNENILSDVIVDELPLERIGRLLALTANNELNALATLRFSEWLGDENVYQLAPIHEGEPEPVHPKLRGRILFDFESGYYQLDERFHRGDLLETITMTGDMDYSVYQARRQETAVPLFILNEDKQLRVSTAVNPLIPSVGQTGIFLTEAFRQPIMN